MENCLDSQFTCLLCIAASYPGLSLKGAISSFADSPDNERMFYSLDEQRKNHWRIVRPIYRQSSLHSPELAFSRL